MTRKGGMSWCELIEDLDDVESELNMGVRTMDRLTLAHVAKELRDIIMKLRAESRRGRK